MKDDRGDDDYMNSDWLVEHQEYLAHVRHLIEAAKHHVCLGRELIATARRLHADTHQLLRTMREEMRKQPTRR